MYVPVYHQLEKKGLHLGTPPVSRKCIAQADGTCHPGSTCQSALATHRFPPHTPNPEHFALLSPLPSAFARLESKAFSFLSAQVHRTPGLHPHFSPSLSVNLEKNKEGSSSQGIIIIHPSPRPPHGDGIHHPHLPPCRKQETTARSQRITRGSSRARRSEYSSSSINPRGVRP